MNLIEALKEAERTHANAQLRIGNWAITFHIGECGGLLGVARHLHLNDAINVDLSALPYYQLTSDEWRVVQ